MNLSHINPDSNQPQMVNVIGKKRTHRFAIAESTVFLGRSIMDTLEDGEIRTAKGPVFQTAIIAGTQAVKKTSELIPFCHPLALDGIDFNITPLDGESVRIACRVEMEGKTGVEMEALTGAGIAALTLYDMCKALSGEIEISRTRLMEKSGGKCDFRRSSDREQ